jgi:hypothetical protein
MQANGLWRLRCMAAAAGVESGKTNGARAAQVFGGERAAAF